MYGNALAAARRDVSSRSSVLVPVIYVAIGVAMAFAVKQALAFALSSDMPMVAVLSQSMQHDNAGLTHYGWLEGRYGYDQEYVSSWPVPTGFVVGDMPVISGAGGYEVGDVIVYSLKCGEYPDACGIPIIHRIIKVNDDGTYQTKGDNNNNQWPYELSVSDEQIHGKVVAVIPKLGYFKVAFSRLTGTA